MQGSQYQHGHRAKETMIEDVKEGMVTLHKKKQQAQNGDSCAKPHQELTRTLTAVSAFPRTFKLIGLKSPSWHYWSHLPDSLPSPKGG